jgi:hypothetical protein
MLYQLSALPIRCWSSSGRFRFRVWNTKVAVCANRTFAFISTTEYPKYVFDVQFEVCIDKPMIKYGLYQSFSLIWPVLPANDFALRKVCSGESAVWVSNWCRLRTHSNTLAIIILHWFQLTTTQISAPRHVSIVALGIGCCTLVLVNVKFRLMAISTGMGSYGWDTSTPRSGTVWPVPRTEYYALLMHRSAC